MTWQEGVVHALQGALIGVTIGSGIIHGGHTTKPVTVPRVAAKRGKAGKTVEKKNGGSSQYSLYSLMRSTNQGYMATQNFLDSITYQIGRLSHQSGGFGVPIFSGASGGVWSAP